MRPLASTRSRNWARPCPRRAITRPATRSRCPLSVPGVSSPNRSRSTATGTRCGNAVGYGSTPRERAASTFARRAWRICCSVSPGSFIATRSLRRADRAGALGGLDAHDLEFDRSAGGGHLDDLALLVAEHRLADRRLVRQPVVGGVGLGRADDLVLIGLAVVDVLNLDLRADRDDVLGDVAGVDHTGAAQLLLEAQDAGFRSACSFLASSYSEFSEMSPNSRAALIRSATSRRLTVSSSEMVAFSFS